MCLDFFKAGVDVLTMGNHTWDKREIIPFISIEPRLIRPANYPEHTPGNGFCEVKLPDGRIALVIQLMGTLFIDPLDNPFSYMQKWLETHIIAQKYQAIVLDFHAEATSEKIAFAHYVKDKASAVLGTHTHVQTADEKIIDGKLAFISDAGMTGPYMSAIGCDLDSIVKRLKGSSAPFIVAKSSGQLSGVVMTFENNSPIKIERILINQDHPYLS